MNWETILATALSVLITLGVTFIFNKLVAFPAAIRQREEAHNQEIAAMRGEIDSLRDQINTIQPAIDNLPVYRQQSLNIQHNLCEADAHLQETCNDIKDNITALSENSLLLQENLIILKIGQDAARDSLKRLEEREKNALRAKIITEYRLFTSKHKNPLQAWSEMEHHAFFALVEDYEALGGNDYVHSVVLPAMNDLEIVSIENIARLEEVMNARQQ